MPFYFRPDQVLISFKRLASRKSQGKTPLERTSILMYFLSFDAVSKKTGKDLLDFNPDRSEGKENRKLIELEFRKLVLIKIEGQEILQVIELSKISNDSKSPEKRISSNFLTVPLKKASEQAARYLYPKRPATPLIKMGQAATGIKWGMKHYDAWSQNLPKLFSEIVTPSVFTDLAIFIFRDTPINEIENRNYVDVLNGLIIEKYTAPLATFWIEKIKKEQVFVKHVKEPFNNHYEPFSKCFENSNHYVSEGHNELEAYVVYLESLLNKSRIEFKHLTRE
jgi:hypothetical protein